MDTSANDPRPADQQARADQARPNPNDPASQPHATPAFGTFGVADSSPRTSAPAANSGANDNPDEFSEFRKPDAPPTEDYSDDASDANPRQQRGHVVQNQDPAAVAATQNADHEDSKEAWAKDDPRYAGGHQRQAYDDDPTHVL